jgi:hypothetical protein
MDKIKKLKALEAYKSLIQDKIANGPTTKHIKRPESYLRFLLNELKVVDSSINKLKEV